MKITYISHGNIPSKWAHTFQVMRMAEAFAQKTDKFCLLTSGSMKKNGAAFDINDWYGIKRPFTIVKLPVYRHLKEAFFTGYRYPRFDQAAALYARVASPDLVYTRSIFAGGLCVRLGLPTIIETHAEPNPDFKPLLACRWAKCLKGIVTITEDLKKLYVKAGLPEKKILVWPNAINPEIYEELPAKAILREELGLPSDKFIAVYAGHLYQHKGIDTILDAARQLPEVHFLIVGGWEKDIASYKKKAEQMKLNNVNFAGFVVNKLVPAYLSAGDCLLMPNSAQSSESWMSPLKLFEYMASQRPIICSDLKPLRTYLRDGHNAFLVQPDDGGLLAKAINRIRFQEVESALLAQNAYNDVQAYTWNKRVSEILKYYFGRVKP